MTLLELVDYLRVSILDDVGGLGIDWTGIQQDDDEAALLRWSNEELTNHINEAINQVYRRILPVKDSALTIPVVLGTSTYALDSSIIQLLGVQSDLIKRGLQEADIQSFFGARDWEAKEGNPCFYIPNYDTGTITLYPKPIVNDTLKLLYYRFPLKKLSWQTPLELVELRDEFQIPMLNYAAYLAYRKDEANTKDANISTSFLVTFNSEFPATSAYSDNRKRKTTNRSVRYGGLRQQSDRHYRNKNRYGSCNFDPYF